MHPAVFVGATFAERASFNQSVFKRAASFDWAQFKRDVSFWRATFEDIAWFNGTTFGETVSFQRAVVRGWASFDETRCVSRVSFLGTAFAGNVFFNKTVFQEGAEFIDVAFRQRATFIDLTFGGKLWFDGSIFYGDVFGDFRSLDISKAKASFHEVLSPAMHIEWLIDRLLIPGVWVWTSLRSGWPGWERVRATGGLSIINRVSLVTLFAVPILAAFYVAAQDTVGTHGVSTESAPWSIRMLASALSEDPHLSASIAFTFFAAVAVSLGLLVYQSNAPAVIKNRDEDEHVEEIETRYSDENRSLRRDGLRRSIERIEDQGMVRNGYHPRFVKHHGVLIWIPPGDKPEWFDDSTLPTADAYRYAQLKSPISRGESPSSEDTQSIDVAQLPFTPPQSRPEFVPDFERARICIEEGARAEYWLKAHESIVAAWISFVCYTIGIMMLLCVVAIQCHNVGRAAGWWPGIDPKPYLRTWFGL